MLSLLKGLFSFQTNSKLQTFSIWWLHFISLLEILFSSFSWPSYILKWKMFPILKFIALHQNIIPRITATWFSLFYLEFRLSCINSLSFSHSHSFFLSVSLYLSFSLSLSHVYMQPIVNVLQNHAPIFIFFFQIIIPILLATLKCIVLLLSNVSRLNQTYYLSHL